MNEHIEQMRLSATKALLERRGWSSSRRFPRFIRSGRSGSLSQDDAAPDAGMIIDQRAIVRRLAELQYARNDQAFQRGTFRVRG